MRKTIAIAVAMLCCLGMRAQTVEWIQGSPHPTVVLPWGISNLSIIDGRIYGCIEGMMVSASTTEGMATNLQPDTTLNHLAMEADYVTRNKHDSILYYTAKTSESPYGFYANVRERFHKYQKIELRGWFRDVVHPVFSDDGQMMVFSSVGRVGLGGHDLWCSFWNGKKWSKPINMGNVVNSTGNEISPMFYGNYLIYASDGLANGRNDYELYSVRLKSNAKSDDIIFGNITIQRLPYPFNSKGNDKELVVDESQNSVYWVSDRDGKDALWTYQGGLESVVLTGSVNDDFGHPVGGAEVRILLEGRRVAITTTDSLGRYTMLLQPSKKYEMMVSRDDYFTLRFKQPVSRDGELQMVAKQKKDVVLPSLAFNRPLRFDNVYSRPLQIEMDSKTENILMPVVNFLRDNPQVAMRVTVVSDNTEDLSFNNTLTEQRISQLQLFFRTVLPPSTQIIYRNGNKPTSNMPLGTRGDIIFITLLK